MRCDASKWRLGTTTVVPGLSLLPPGTTAVVPGLFPLALDAVIPARHSLGCPYVTRGLCVVDRTVGACPITCSPRHLTSYLSHPYISTHSLRSHWPLALFPSLCFSVSLRAWVLRQRDSHRLVAIRAGQDRDSQRYNMFTCDYFVVYGIAQYCSVISF